VRHTTLEKQSSHRGPQRRPADQGLPTSLHISEPSDSHEQEAERVADQVMAGKREWSISNLGSQPVQRQCSCGSSGGECEKCQGKDEPQLQRQAVGPAESTAPAIVHEVLSSSGKPLDRPTRDFFEPRFGYDFAKVRLHADSRAGDSARAVGAHAYTVGNDIVFDHGQYSPGSAQGRRLLAHELAHTLQQRPVLSRQPKAPDRPLPPHDPSPKFAPTGACYGSAICKDLKTPDKLLKEAEEDEANKDKAERRKELCGKRPPDPACTADGHGAPAVECAKLLHDYDPARPPAGTKMLVNKDLPHQFGALGVACSDFVPPVAGARCITVPDKMEEDAGKFNNTMEPTIDGMERGKWRADVIKKLVHESEHVRFRKAYSAGQFPVTGTADCATSNTVAAMNELTAMLSEFPVVMEWIRGNVSAPATEHEEALEKWREHRILGTSQSITVSLRTVRCACNCEDANKMIREAVEFAIASWSQQDKNDLHRELRSPRWNDLDLRWPFVAPPNPGVTRP
jgi:hypothetical protein